MGRSLPGALLPSPSSPQGNGGVWEDRSMGRAGSLDSSAAPRCGHQRRKGGPAAREIQRSSPARLAGVLPTMPPTEVSSGRNVGEKRKAGPTSREQTGRVARGKGSVRQTVRPDPRGSPEPRCGHSRPRAAGTPMGGGGGCPPAPAGASQPPASPQAEDPINDKENKEGEQDHVGQELGLAPPGQHLQPPHCLAQKAGR